MLYHARCDIAIVTHMTLDELLVGSARIGLIVIGRSFSARAWSKVIRVGGPSVPGCHDHMLKVLLNDFK